MTMEGKGVPMLEVVGLKKYFEVAAGTVRSVDGR